MKYGTLGVRLALALGAIGALATGCADKKAVSKENFVQALNENYSANKDCLFDRALPFPYEVSLHDGLLATTRRRLDALTSAGLLTREQRTQGHDTVNRYSLTPAGAQVPGGGRFCYGSREVTAVEAFTEPSEFHGNRFTHVEYRFKEKSAADWARAEVIREAFPSVAKAMGDQPVDKATLVLTDNGWELNSD